MGMLLLEAAYFKVRNNFFEERSLFEVARKFHWEADKLWQLPPKVYISGFQFVHVDFFKETHNHIGKQMNM